MCIFSSLRKDLIMCIFSSKKRFNMLCYCNIDIERWSIVLRIWSGYARLKPENSICSHQIPIRTQKRKRIIIDLKLESNPTIRNEKNCINYFKVILK